MSARELVCGQFRLPLDRPLIMGIVNVTPDSFSGDGLGRDIERACEQAERFVGEGADLLDVGGESTRPGAMPVPVQEELDRVIPVIEALSGLRIPVSVDTWKPEVMEAAVAAGASVINDINGLRAPRALEVVARSDVAVCLMHMQGNPQTMQGDPHYDDVVAEVGAFLRERVGAAQRAGIAAERIILDPGFGFGKTAEHNLALLRGLGSIAALGYPVLAGLSRKSLLGKLTGRAVGERMPASVTAALLAVERGARMVRVHDVGATRDALAVWRAVSEGHAAG
ncbi:MAG: dihydropteroate synthase [Betaproteobacteria bacterium]|nr:dihydropteroate synthase [Betaproteobacteria bacterium]